jgi:predicted secreted protein
MTITAAIVLFSVTWFMVFFIVLALRTETQVESGAVVPGTPKGAPSTNVVRRRALVTTVVALVLWAALCGIILSGWISIRDIDVFGRMGPPG